MEAEKLKKIVEGALLAAGRPVKLDQLEALFEDRERPERAAIREAIETLKTDYEERSMELKEVASGYRIQVREEVSDWVSRLWEERPSRYSRALLETLALVAYRQPITRGEIEEVRGVSVSTSIIRTLQERGWIKVVGHRDVPGRPAMFGTTREFLDYFNLKSLDELPTLAEIRDIDSINVELELDAGGEDPQAQETESRGWEDSHPDTDADTEAEHDPEEYGQEEHDQEEHEQEEEGGTVAQHEEETAQENEAAGRASEGLETQEDSDEEEIGQSEQDLELDRQEEAHEEEPAFGGEEAGDAEEEDTAESGRTERH